MTDMAQSSPDRAPVMRLHKIPTAKSGCVEIRPVIQYD